MSALRALLLAVLALLSVAGPSGAAAPGPFEALDLVRFRSGIRVPPFALSDLSGQPVSVSASPGSATLVVFWATW